MAKFPPFQIWLSYTFVCGILTLPCYRASAQSPGVPLRLRMSSEIAPPGSSVQFKLLADSPALISGGAFTIDLDPTVFGEISDLTVFGATGDALGYATVSGRHAEVHLSSPSGSIGQLPGLPVAVLTVPVITGATVPVTIDASAGSWFDPNGKLYTVTAVPGEFRSGGDMWVRSVTPGGGYLPAGTVLRLSGGGFDATTKVAVDGVSIATQQLIDPQHIELTLGGATEMTAKHMIVTNGSGERQEFFTAIPGAPAASVSPFPDVFPIVPLSVSQKFFVNSNIPSNSAVQNGLALMNQRLEPVTVTFVGLPYLSGNYSQVSLTVPPSSMYFLRLNTLSEGQVPSYTTSRYWVKASAPIRMMTWASKFGQSTYVGVPGDDPSEPPSVSLSNIPDTVTWTWQSGTPMPASVTVPISSTLPFTATADVPWIRTGKADRALVLTPQLAGLVPGRYSANITLTPVLPPQVTEIKTQSSVVHATLTVSAVPLLTSLYCCAFLSGGGSFPSSSSSIAINSNGAPITFTVTTSGEPWLSLNVDRGTTPAVLNLTPRLTGLQPGNYTAQITVIGPDNTLKIPVYLTVISSQPPAPQLRVSPASMSFVLEAGTAGPLSGQLLVVTPLQSGTFTTRTFSGGDWLKTQASGSSLLSVNATAVNLGAGDYTAEIGVSVPGYPSVTVPVALTVLPAPTGSTLRVSPAELSLSTPVGIEKTATITVDSTGRPILVQASLAASSRGIAFGVRSGYIAADGKFTTPATLTIYVNSGQPGAFRGAITFQALKNLATVPVTLDVAPDPGRPPQIASVTNAASGVAGALAPGEIFSIFGLGIGSLADPNAASVLVNGVAAPLLYNSSGQLNAVVPYEAGTSGIAKVKVTVAGVSSNEWGIPLAPAAPAIFTVNASGAGPGAVLNQDYSVNTIASPAVRGSVIQIFGTGQGLTSPPSLTGALSSSAGNSAVLPVKVTIGGIEAIVQYQGAAPGLISGALQVNAFVPPDVTPGVAVPLSLSVGGLPSQAGVTIAVR